MILFLLVGVNNVFAFDIYKREGRLFLADGCDNGGALYQSLARWGKNTQSDKSCDRGAQMQQKSSGRCEIEITQCVPEHVVRYHNATPEMDGPNCWNLSLVMSKILPSMRYSSPAEMNFYMRPPLCRELQDGEIREPGDVGAIRQIADGGETIEYHGFIYISEKIAYSKNGYSKQSPYELQSLANVYDTYSVPNRPECRKNQINSQSAGCGQAVSFFRCDSMDKYLEKTPHVPTEIRSSFDRMKAAESCLQQSAFAGGGVLSSEATNNLRETGQALLAYLEEEKASKTVQMDPAEHDFLVGSLQLRLEAVADQLYVGRFNSEANQVSEELRGFASSIAKARSSLKETGQ